MSTQTISRAKMLRFSVSCILVSSIAAVAFILFRNTGLVSGPAGSFGIMSAFIGSGVASWFAFRFHDRSLLAAAFASALPLAFWVWVLYDLVRVSAT